VIPLVSTSDTDLLFAHAGDGDYRLGGPETLAALRQAYLDTEGDLEAR
jgi:hypothetical protein